MRIFLFEFVSGGGWFKVDPPDRPAPALLSEGKAMLQALGDDFAAMDGCEVVYTQDRRVKKKVRIGNFEPRIIAEPVEVLYALREEAPRCDWGVIIAPEFEQQLFDHVVKWTMLGGKLLGPGSDFIRLAGSKHATAEHLRAAGVAAPRGIPLGWPEKLPADFPLPAVLKPDDGVGSRGILMVRERKHGAVTRRMNATEWRLEEYCPGLAASVAILNGPHGPVALPACLQWLANDRNFRYRGGMTPLAADLNARAQRLALAAAQALPKTLGYFGVDLVLGDAADGSRDLVIEVNPRLTTSYVGLRAIAKQNLAQAMVDIATGRERHLTFSDERVQFTPQGDVIELS